MKLSKTGRSILTNLYRIELDIKEVNSTKISVTRIDSYKPKMSRRKLMFITKLSFPLRKTWKKLMKKEEQREREREIEK